MPHATTLIVCERTDHWVIELRLAFSRAATATWADNRKSGSQRESAAEPRIIETRFADDCLAALAQAPQAVVAVELSVANGDLQLALVRAINERYPAARVVVLAARELSAHQWLARELGAIHFTTSPRRLAEVVELARRHWQSLPAPESAGAEAIWESLPWQGI